jgi:UDP-N-acetylglucosamine transferase subunit ALG13
MTSETKTFSVVASVGTYHHPFDRFVQWLEPWTTQNHADVVFQHGCTRPMEQSDNHEMLSHQELLEHYSSADAIVLQGGAGGVMDARKVGRIPIVVPRIPVDHEVVDNHQVILCRRLADLGLVHVAESADELARLLDGVRGGTVNSRVDAGRPSPGVAETVRLLTTRPAPRTTFEQPDLIKIRAVRRPRMLAAVANLLLRRGLLGQMLGLTLPLLILRALGVPPVYVGVTIGVIALWLLCATMFVAKTNRARSVRPAISLIAVTGVGAVLAWIGVVDGREFRLGLVAALIAAATLSLAALLNRLAYRRTPTILIGEDLTVRRLATQWGDRDDVDVVASCTWPDGTKPDQAGWAVSRLLPEVTELVIRHQVRSAVFAAEQPVAKATMKRMRPDLSHAGAKCVLETDRG